MNGQKLVAFLAFLGGATFFVVNLTTGALPGGFIGGALGGGIGAGIGLLINEFRGTSVVVEPWSGRDLPGEEELLKNSKDPVLIRLEIDSYNRKASGTEPWVGRTGIQILRGCGLRDWIPKQERQYGPRLRKILERMPPLPGEIVCQKSEEDGWLQTDKRFIWTDSATGRAEAVSKEEIRSLKSPLWIEQVRIVTKDGRKIVLTAKGGRALPGAYRKPNVIA